MENNGEGEEAWRRVALWDRMVSEHNVINVIREGKVGIIELSYLPKANAMVASSGNYIENRTLVPLSIICYARKLGFRYPKI